MSWNNVFGEIDQSTFRVDVFFQRDRWNLLDMEMVEDIL